MAGELAIASSDGELEAAE